MLFDSHNFSRNSCVILVANGATNCKKSKNCHLVICFVSYTWFTNIISFETAVLNFSFSISSVTPFIVLWSCIVVLWSSASLKKSCIRSTLSKNLLTPSTAPSFHAFSNSSGHMNIVYVLNTSDPLSCQYFSTRSPGVMTFPQRFDILRPSGPSTIPWWNNFWNGSGFGIYHWSNKNLLINLLYKRWP